MLELAIVAIVAGALDPAFRPSLIQQPPTSDDAVDTTLYADFQPPGNEKALRLIAQLDGLREDFTKEDFLNRQALMELVAMMDVAALDLKNAVETSPSWSIRASAAYALLVNEFGTVEGFSDTFLRKDASPIVRAITASSVVQNGGGWCMDVDPASRHVDPEEDYWRERLSLEYTAEWIEPAYREKRLTRIYEVLGTMNPVVMRAEEEVDADTGIEKHTEVYAPTLLATAVKRVVEHESRQEGGDSLLQKVFSMAEVESDPLRKGFLLDVITDPIDSGYSRSASARSLSSKILSFIDQHIWEEDNPFLLDSMSNFVCLIAFRDESALELAKRLRNHGHSKVRDDAIWICNSLEDLEQARQERLATAKAEEEYWRTVDRLHMEQYLKENAKREAEIKAHNEEVWRRHKEALAQQAKKSQDTPTPREDSSTTRTITWAVGIAAVLVAGYFILRKRA